tara:strand:- start:4736 stop:4957 length:222 start_codon:yes stop_codon:yes gene_type:complete
LCRRHFFKQLREFFGPHAPQRTNIHMPKRFGLPDQASPGAHLLPPTQPVLNGMTTTVDENGHGFTLLRRQQNS